MDDSNLLAVGILWYVVFLLSTVLHEAAHALAARLGGDTTSDSQVTVDPLPHITREPVGMVLVPLLSYVNAHWMMGWASTPYDPTWASRHPRRAAWMALAGPLANFLIAVLAGVAIRGGVALGYFSNPRQIDGLAHAVATTDGQFTAVTMLLSIAFTLNLLLCLFNLMPLPPLDGSSVITLLMSESLARRWQEAVRQPMLTLVALAAAWMLFGRLGSPLFGLALKLLYPNVPYTSH